MEFTVIPYSQRSRHYGSLKGEEVAFLVRDNWDDYGFKTSFSLIYFDDERKRYDLGPIKILRAGMRSGYTPMPEAVRISILDALREELSFEAPSRRSHNRDSWQAGLYRALSLSDPFCDGGFEQID